MSPPLRALTVDRDMKWENGKKLGFVWEIQKEGKEVALGFLDRLLVVTSLPAGAKKVLNEALKKRLNDE